jgi:hypothetical protein
MKTSHHHHHQQQQKKSFKTDSNSKTHIAQCAINQYINLLQKEMTFA